MTEPDPFAGIDPDTIVWGTATLSAEASSEREPDPAPEPDPA